MKALVLAGGYPQIALINELKSRGYTVLLADYYPNPIAKAYAHEFYQVSTLDVEAITDLARREKVDFLITACTDQALHTVALVSERLGLPCYIDHQTALNVTNKRYMKQVFAENGVPTAKHCVMTRPDKAMLEGMEYPLIVKPADANSSKGVIKIQSPEEFEDAFARSVCFSRTDTAVVEEFVEGQEITVDVQVTDGKAVVLSKAYSDKIADAERFVIYRTRFPVCEPDVIHQQIQDAAQRIADAFGLKNSLMLVQLISNGKRIFVLEFSARTGGGVKFELIKNVCGFDVISAVVDLTLGKKPTVELRPPLGRYITNTFVYCKPGVFDRLEGFEELKQEGILHSYSLFKWRGAGFEKVESSGDRICGFTIISDTLEEQKRKYNAAVQRIKVLDENGSDMVRRDLLGELYYEN